LQRLVAASDSQPLKLDWRAQVEVAGGEDTGRKSVGGIARKRPGLRLKKSSQYADKSGSISKRITEMHVEAVLQIEA
jgi:hypothetical protein